MEPISVSEILRATGGRLLDRFDGEENPIFP